MISAVAHTLDRRSTLIVITGASDDRVQRARRQGARVVLVDFNVPSTLVSLRLWRHLSRLLPRKPSSSSPGHGAAPEQSSWLDRPGSSGAG